MNRIKRFLGFVWMALGPLAIAFLIYEAWLKIAAQPTQDVYLPWIIIITIFTPVGAGLVIFGWFALKGEYDTLPDVTDLEE